MSKADELKLKELLDSNVISQEEFIKKKELLDYEDGQTVSSTDGIENKLDSKSDKNKSKKWYIIAGVFLVLYIIGSVGGETYHKSTSVLPLVIILHQATVPQLVNLGQPNHQLMQLIGDIMDNISVNAIDASNGTISFATFESYLESDLRNAKNIYNNQLSLSPDSANVTS